MRVENQTKTRLRRLEFMAKKPRQIIPFKNFISVALTITRKPGGCRENAEGVPWPHLLCELRLFFT
jgi:hypothetical protein